MIKKNSILSKSRLFFLSLDYQLYIFTPNQFSLSLKFSRISLQNYNKTLKISFQFCLFAAASVITLLKKGPPAPLPHLLTLPTPPPLLNTIDFYYNTAQTAFLYIYIFLLYKL